jgi:hypothetical protein
MTGSLWWTGGKEGGEAAFFSPLFSSQRIVILACPDVSESAAKDLFFEHVSLKKTQIQ